MNWFAFQPTAESLLQKGFLFLAVVAALFAIIAIFTLVLLLYTMLAVPSSDSQLVPHQHGEETG